MLELFFTTIKDIAPIILLLIVIYTTIRITYLIYNKKKVVLYKELLVILFIIYALLLYYIVTFQDSNYGTSNYIPFKEIFRYEITSNLFYKNVLGNIFLFVPLGIFVTLYIKNKHFYLTMILSLIISFSIECIQSVIGRTFDIDDIILNTLGGLIGFILCKLFHKITLKFPKFIKSEMFLNLLSIIVILVIIYLFKRFNLWRLLV